MKLIARTFALDLRTKRDPARAGLSSTGHQFYLGHRSKPIVYIYSSLLLTISGPGAVKTFELSCRKTTPIELLPVTPTTDPGESKRLLHERNRKKTMSAFFRKGQKKKF
ncbi:uncharacterized protein LOC143258938 [Megalopta genalis]|uniref:uncharacterized protein LOC143258938 n=1 Tax=Megalopta genalis TaxID=115081 RepID=UPI003FCF0DF2